MARKPLSHGYRRRIFPAFAIAVAAVCHVLLVAGASIEISAVASAACGGLTLPLAIDQAVAELRYNASVTRARILLVSGCESVGGVDTIFSVANISLGNSSAEGTSGQVLQIRPSPSLIAVPKVQCQPDSFFLSLGTGAPAVQLGNMTVSGCSLGAVLLTSSDAFLAGVSVVFENNSGGGAISVSGGSRLELGGNCSFVGNQNCYNCGGGALSISGPNSSVVVAQNASILFLGNAALSGGAIHVGSGASLQWSGADSAVFDSNRVASSEPFQSPYGGHITVDGGAVSGSLGLLSLHNGVAFTDLGCFECPGSFGGAIAILNAGAFNLSIGEMDLRNNTGWNGGGLYANSASAVVLQCEVLQVEGNSAVAGQYQLTLGGGMYISSCPVVLISGRSNWLGNVARSLGLSAKGAALFMQFSTLVMEDAFFAGNMAQALQADAEGGCMSLTQSTLLLSASDEITFVGNSAAGQQAAQGGCLSADGSTVAFVSRGTVVVAGNTVGLATTAKGGAFFLTGSLFSLEISSPAPAILQDNRVSGIAEANGGALSFLSSNATFLCAMHFENNSVFGNSSVNYGGGGVFLADTVAEFVEDVVFKCNTVVSGSAQGGALSILQTMGANVVAMGNVFFLNNSAHDMPSGNLRFLKSDRNVQVCGGALSVSCSVAQQSQLPCVVVNTTVFQWNEVRGMSRSSKAFGGAACFQSAVVRVTGNIVASNNTARTISSSFLVHASRGGAFYMTSSSLLLDPAFAGAEQVVLFDGNQAIGGKGYGGALDAENYGILLADGGWGNGHYVFTNNRADFGGAMSVDTSSFDYWGMSAISIEYRNNTAVQDGGALYLFSSSLTLQPERGTHFEQNVALLGRGGAVFCGGSSYIRLANVSFVANQALASSGGAVFFSAGSMWDTTDFLDSAGPRKTLVTFTDNRAVSGGAICVDELSQIDSISEDVSQIVVVLSSNQATSTGGAVSVFSQSSFVAPAKLYILNNTVDPQSGGAGGGGGGSGSGSSTSSVALLGTEYVLGGGGIYVDASSRFSAADVVQISGNQVRGSAVGGGFYFGSCLSFSGAASTMFILANTASAFGGGGFVGCDLGNCIYNTTTISSFRYASNWAPSNADWAAYPTSASCSGFDSVEPGRLFDLTCEFLDEGGQPSSASGVYVSFPASDVLVSSTGLQTAATALFSRLQLVGDVGTNVTFVVTDFCRLYSSFSTLLQPCSAGWGLYNSTYKRGCSDCIRGVEYNIFPNDHPCLPCPESSKATCVADQVLWNNGFWASFDAIGAVAMYDCDPQLCRGSGTCAPNRDPTSVLCGECLPGYSEWNRVCLPCPDASPGLIVGVIATMLAVAVVVYLLAQNASGLARTFVNCTQMMILIVFPVQIPVLSFLTFAVVSPSTSRCPFPRSSIEVFLTDLGAVPVVLLLGLVVFCVLRMVHHVCLRKRAQQIGILPMLDGLTSRHSFYRFVSSLLIFGYQLLASVCTAFFNCRQIGTAWVVFQEPSISCSSDAYRGWAPLFGLLLVVIVGTPVAVFFFVRRKRIEKLVAIQPAGASPSFLDVLYEVLSQPYKKEFLYWETVVLVRKFLLVVLFDVFSILSSFHLRRFFMSLTVLVMLVAQIKLQPFDGSLENTGEAVSLGIMTVLSVLVGPNDETAYNVVAAQIIVLLYSAVFAVAIVVNFARKVSQMLNRSRWRSGAVQEPLVAPSYKFYEL